MMNPILQETFDANLSRTAIDCSVDIQRFQSNGDASSSAHRIIQKICQVGLDTAEMRDEILIQLCRQVTENTKESPKNWLRSNNIYPIGNLFKAMVG
jgi:hypothetical protein